MSTQLQTQAAIALFFGCLVTTTVLTPLVMVLARRVGAVDRGGYRKVFRGEMPLLGGLAIAAPLLLVSLTVAIAGHAVVANWRWVFSHYHDYFNAVYSMVPARHDSLRLGLGGIGILALGLLDDIKGLRARWKLLGQVLVALFVCISGNTLNTISLPFLGSIELEYGVGVALAMLWVVGIINAFNLIDGIDGLAAGIGLVGAMALLVLSITQDNAFVTLATASLAGGLLGFLFFNFPPARIFLGDTGSMFIGYVLASVSLIGTQKSDTIVIIFVPMLALGLPIFETLVSIVRRYLRGVPVFAGDARHTHHRLLGKGYSQPRVVLTLCGVSVLLSVAAVTTAQLPRNSSWMGLPYGLYGAALLYVAWLAGYLRPATFRRTLARRQRNRVLHALSKYVGLRLNSGIPSITPEFLLELCRYELGLVHIELCLESGHRLVASSRVNRPEIAQATTEKLTVRSSDEREILIWYVFAEEPDREHRHDVSACLAAIFDQIDLTCFGCDIPCSEDDTCAEVIKADHAEGADADHQTPRLPS